MRRTPQTKVGTHRVGRIRLWAGTALFLASLGLASLGPASLGLAMGRASTVWTADVNAGPTLLLRSKSKAIGHLLKPTTWLAVRAALLPRLEVGGGITALLDSSPHYRVLGGLALARYALLDGARFSLGVNAALGLGYDADILHSDLRGGGGVLPYAGLSTDARWVLSGRWLVGGELGWQNLSMLRLGITVGIQWGKEAQP